MTNENIDIGKMIDEETSKRLKIMQSDDYEWPEVADSKDVVGILVMIGVSVALIVACTTGVVV